MRLLEQANAQAEKALDLRTLLKVQSVVLALARVSFKTPEQLVLARLQRHGRVLDPDETVGKSRDCTSHDHVDKLVDCSDSDNTLQRVEPILEVNRSSLGLKELWKGVLPSQKSHASKLKRFRANQVATTSIEASELGAPVFSY